MNPLQKIWKELLKTEALDEAGPYQIDPLYQHDIARMNLRQIADLPFRRDRRCDAEDCQP